jgi:hypothetical protein
MSHLNNSGEPGAPETRGRNRWSITLRGLLVVVAVISIYVAIGGWGRREWIPRPQRWITLDCGEGREIVIWLDFRSEDAPSLYYEVIVNDKVVTKMCFCFVVSSPSNTDLHLLSAENGNLVGVVEGTPPDCSKVVILHDFSTGESWPELDGKTGSKHSEQVRKLKEAMQLRLRRANPDAKCLH